MITPHPTSKIDPAVARGVLHGTSGERVVFAVPDTNYQLHLLPTGPITTPVGKRLLGVIRAKARRMDHTTTGGQFIEPVMGRPRRVQGTVLRVDANSVVIDAGVPIHCEPTDPRQRPDIFKPGDFLGFDVLDGATITPA
jgi:hypothetical protein